MVFWIDIFKSGSSSLKRELLPHLCPPQKLIYDGIPGDPDRDCLVLLRRGYMRLNQTDLSNVTAFATVRHPVRRFISGYGTVMHRSRSYKQIFQADGDMIAKIARMKEPHRFRACVDWFTTKARKK
mmetsp:Transcript_30368/g.48730  ORF Transcript_30368/g.48730 Transcript_30368/m.48730 type:complete len:126 (+) Transcript_30368:559-936(+)